MPEDPPRTSDSDSDSESESEGNDTNGGTGGGGGGPPRPAHLPPGYDEVDPYEGEDLSAYPEWWRRNIEEFRAHGMRPYRPPRFTDGAYTPPTIQALEDDLGIAVQLRGVNPQEGNAWEIRVDGETVATVGRRREGEGYTLYEMASGEFEAVVRDAAA